MSKHPRPSTSKDPSDVESIPSSGEETDVTKKRRVSKTYAQKYNANWEKDPAFKGWLQSSRKGPTFANCKACCKDFVCGKSEILKHSRGQFHLRAVKSKLKQPALTELPALQRDISLENKIKAAEIRIAAFAVEHNVAFNVLDHLSEVIRCSFTDSEIARKYTNGRTKATAIVNNVLGSYSLDKTVRLLQTNKFSLIVDESTDKGSIKHLALVARVFDENCVKDIFLGLLPVPNATAEALYSCIIEYFRKHRIDKKKI